MTVALGSHHRGTKGDLVVLAGPSNRHDYVVALAGNPNTGKSTVFNALTGLRQHTGNWPGKTVTRAEGLFSNHGKRAKVVDLPGTYSLQAGSADEKIKVMFADNQGIAEDLLCQIREPGPTGDD